MRFKEIIHRLAKVALIKTYQLFTMPLNVIWYYLFHRKFSFEADQKTLWEDRTEKDFEQIAEVEKDPYYRKFDEHILGKLKGCDSRSYLEIGCYCGYRLNKFAGQLGDKMFVGLELGFKNLCFGRRALIKSRNVFLINADAKQLPMKDGSVDTVYTAVCLTHINYSSIDKVLKELLRVCAKNLLLVEVDHRPMKFKKKVACLNWGYGYMHPYEKIISDRAKLVSAEPLYDMESHPRYTVFQFAKTGG